MAAPTASGLRVADIIGEQVRRSLDEALHDSEGLLKRVAQAGGKEAADDILGKTDKLVGLVLDLAVAAAALDPPAEAALATVRGLSEGGGNLAHQWLWAYVIYEVLLPLARPFELPLVHAVNAFTTNEIHDPNTSADLVARGLFTDDHGRSEAAGSGFDRDHFERLVSLARNRPDVGTALELLRRDELSANFVEGELRHLGYDPDTVKALMSLRRVLVSPADLALALLRGDIDREQMLTYAKQLGVDEADMELLVGNTGEPPGVMQLLEAYRRGFIDKPRLERGIRQSRMRNEWIPTVEGLRYSPMSIANAVRAVVENYITPAEGQRIAAESGLKPEHFPILHESWGRPLAHVEMATLVHRGLASRKQFDQAMRESDLKDKYINLSFDSATRLLPIRQILDAVKHGVLSTKDGAKRLLQQGYKPEDAAVIMKLGLAESHSTGHELTRAEIVSLYSDRVLSHDEALQHLEAMGFSHTDAGYILTLADTQAHLKELRGEQAAIRVSYLANGIDAVKAESQLVEIGVSRAQAQHLIAVWDREKHRAARVLTEAQIVKAAKEGTLSSEAALTLLTASGYSHANATILLRSNGVLTGTSAARALGGGGSAATPSQ